jgi:ERF superfamily
MTDSIHKAMSKAFAAIEGATKDTNNPFFKTKYADLSSVVAAIKPALIANELWFRQVNHERDGGVCVETIVGHSSGGEISFGTLFVPASKNDAQAYGSALTYARRYSLQTAFGVCPEDDDGNAAVTHSKAQTIDAAPIDQTQRGIITDLAAAAEVNILTILESYNAENIDALTAKQAEAVIKRLNLTIDKKVAKKENA